MTDYTKATDFAAKDALLTGNPAKIVKGAEIDTEFNNLQTAIATKYDSGDTIPIANGGTGATSASAARTALGSTTVGDAVFIAASAAAGRTALVAAASGANTDITSLNAPALGAATATTATAGDSSTKVATTEFVMGNSPKQIQPITASVAANALTITLNPTTLDFRSATLTSGTVNTRAISAAISLTISSGSTLGTVSAQQSRIAVLAIDNAGTVELAAVNIAGGNDLSETGLISTTAEGGAGAADSASTIYSTTARSNVPYRVVGYVESTQATAGTWATAPSTIQGYGGQAFAAMSSLGYGQTWQTHATGSGTTYYNTYGKPIELSIYSATTINSVVVNGVNILNVTGTNMAYASFTVPPGQSYTVTATPFTAAAVLR